MTHRIKLLGHNTQRKKVKMSRDLIGVAHQVLSSNELEIQELVNRISAARYIPEVTKETMIAALSKVVKEEELKEQDVDDMKDQVRDMEKKLKDKIYKDEWDRRDDEAVALQDRIDKKKADIKDKESRTTHGSGHKSPGQTSYRGA